MKSGLIILFLLTGIHCLAQEHDIDPSAIADDLARYGDSELNYEDLYENYLQLISNPLDLNTATGEDLRTLNVLSERQIQNLLKHITDNGKLISVYELQAVRDFDAATIEKIFPLVTVTDEQTRVGKSFFKRIANRGNSYFVTRYERTLESSKGFEVSDNPENQFAGNADKLYVRFRSAQSKDYSFGFTGEKDAGEALQWNEKEKYYGIDYWSFHAQLLNKKRLRNLIVGDFQYQFGQGVVLGNSFGLGKGGETVNTVRKSTIGFTPYTSVNESGLMRGAATTLVLSKRIFLSAFYSKVNRDATLSSDSASHFTAIHTTGLHRNPNELSGRHAIEESNTGAVVQYKTRAFDVGLTINRTAFDVPWQRRISPYNQFAFSGNQNINSSLFFGYTIYNFNFFGEAAKTLDGGDALLAGLVASVDTKLDMSLLFRRYERDYITFYANAFAESTTPQNETGFYWGLKYKVSRRVTASAYVDLFTFPWLKFRTYTPSSGNEVLMRLQYQPSRKIVMYVQARQKQDVKNLPGDNVTYQTGESIKQNLLINCDYHISENIRLKTRAQMSRFQFNNATTKGLAMMQDITVRVKRLQLSARFALFDTDNFENRQYAYENDAWLAYSLPAYHDNGVRSYLMAQYKFSKMFTVWVRYSRTRYNGLEQIGSGVDTIEGNSRNDIKLQLRISL